MDIYNFYNIIPQKHNSCHVSYKNNLVFVIYKYIILCCLCDMFVVLFESRWDVAELSVAHLHHLVSCGFPKLSTSSKSIKKVLISCRIVVHFNLMIYFFKKSSHKTPRWYSQGYIIFFYHFILSKST